MSIMKQQIEDFVTSDVFGGLFNVPYDIVTGDLCNFRDSKLKNSKGIYFIYCETLNVSYIGMTSSGASARFERHIGRAEGEIYGDKKYTENWGYFSQWCTDLSHSYKNKSKYVFVRFHGDLTKDHLEWLEDSAIKKFRPLINSKSFHLFGKQKLESLKTTYKGTTLFTYK